MAHVTFHYPATRRHRPWLAVAVVGGSAVDTHRLRRRRRPAGRLGQVAAVIKGLDNPFFQTMESGIKDQASDGGSRSRCRPPTRSPTPPGRPTSSTGLAGQDFNCFIVNPITGTNLIQGIAQLSAKNIPIVNIDSPIDAGRRQGRQRQDRHLHRHRQHRCRGQGRRADGQAAARRAARSR